MFRVASARRAIGIACRLQAVVTHARDTGDANDCFCRPRTALTDESLYRNSHISLRYIRDAIVEKLARDGVTIDGSAKAALDEADAELCD